MNVYNTSYSEAIRRLGQACPTFSQLEEMEAASSSSQQQQRPPTPQPSPQSPPANYHATGYEYNFANFGLPHYSGHYQYYKLIDPIEWTPKSTPATLILAMNNLNVIKVGLAPDDNIHINSIAYEMHRAMSPLQQSIDIDYLTHNSLLYMRIDERTNVQLLRDEYVCMAPTACLSRWPTSTLKAVSMRVYIDGFRRCCGRLEMTFNVKSMMIEDCDNYDEGYGDIITLL